MSETITRHVNVPTAGQPAIVPLPTDTFACAGCGIAVEAPWPEVIQVELDTREVTEDFIYAGVKGTRKVMRTEWFEVTRCTACARLHAIADATVATHPVLAQRLGGIAAERLLGALYGAAIIGQPVADALSEVDAFDLIEHFGVGGGAAWQGHAKPEHCTSAPWAHVADAMRQVLRDAAVQYLRVQVLRTERPRRFGPPVDSDRRGCLFCGVGALLALPQDQNQLWTELTLQPWRHGGAGEPIEGHVCPSCETAIADEGGSVGPTSLTRAVFAHIGRTSALTGDFEYNVPPWGMLAGAKPNSEPWDHVDLEPLRSLYVGSEAWEGTR